MKATRQTLQVSKRSVWKWKFILILLPAIVSIAACDSSNQQPTESTSSQTNSQSPLKSQAELKPDPKAGSQTSLDSGSNSPIASPLINVDELKSLLATKSKRVKILEPGKDKAVSLEEHLPTAQFIHWVEDMTDPNQVAKYNNPRTQQFADLMSRLGIENDDHVIVYDRMNSRLSTRLFWSLKFFGHQRVQILDGGFELWKSGQNPTSQKVTQPTASNYRVASTNDALMASMDFVKAQFKQSETRLIDGRPSAQFSGQQAGKVFHTHQEHPRKGHIPGAVNVFWKDNFNEDGTFKSLRELRDLYSGKGILPNNEVITYCNEGLHAAPPWFVLNELLGYKNVRLYDSSMAEWSTSKMPMERK